VLIVGKRFENSHPPHDRERDTIHNADAISPVPPKVSAKELTFVLPLAAGAY